MSAAVNKVRRRSQRDELVVEQTRDLSAVAQMLRAAGISPDSGSHPGWCLLTAYWGDQPVGVTSMETKVDVAIVHALWVVESMRHRGIGAALANAVRSAAHTRGARQLFAFVSDELEGYVQRLGYARVAESDALEALTGTFAAEHMRAHIGDLARLSAYVLDISQDGVILR